MRVRAAAVLQFWALPTRHRQARNGSSRIALPPGRTASDGPARARAAPAPNAAAGTAARAARRARDPLGKSKHRPAPAAASGRRGSDRYAAGGLLTAPPPTAGPLLPAAGCDLVVIWRLRSLLRLLRHEAVRQDELVLAAGLADHERDLCVWGLCVLCVYLCVL